MSLILGAPPSSSTNTKALSSGLALTVNLTTALPVGRAALKLLGGISKVSEENEKKVNDFPEDRIQIPIGINPQNLKSYTLYDVLGLTPEWADSADAEAIKKAYHKAVLMYHPDKAQFKSADGKEDRTVFLKIQEAFNVLCNEQKRRTYDSQLPFNEAIPTEEHVQKALAKGPHKFFKLFDPVFKRNARFAVTKPVPDLGDMDTPMDQVYKFYDYWIKFESWRDFTGIGAEHNPDNAGSREEKRYMQKENERLAKKLKKREMDRIIELVMLSEKRDPRIAADKERRQKLKDDSKNAKEADARKKTESLTAATEWNNQQEAEFIAKNSLSKADKDKLKKNQSNARNLLRKLLRASAAQGHGSGEYGILTAADVDIVCAESDLEDLNIINNALGGAAAAKDTTLFLIAGAEEILSRLSVYQGRQAQGAEDEKMIKDAKKRESDEKNTKKVPSTAPRVWSKESLSVLNTSMLRYPAGTANRWTMVSYYLTDKLKPDESFSVDEAMIAAHQLFVSTQSSAPAAAATADEA